MEVWNDHYNLPNNWEYAYTIDNNRNSDGRMRVGSTRTIPEEGEKARGRKVHSQSHSFHNYNVTTRLRRLGKAMRECNLKDDRVRSVLCWQQMTIDRKWISIRMDWDLFTLHSTTNVHQRCHVSVHFYFQVKLLCLSTYNKT